MNGRQATHDGEHTVTIEPTIHRTEAMASKVIARLTNGEEARSLRQAFDCAVTEAYAITGGETERRLDLQTEVAASMVDALFESGAVEAAIREGLRVPSCTSEERDLVRSVWLAPVETLWTSDDATRMLQRAWPGITVDDEMLPLDRSGPNGELTREDMLLIVGTRLSACRIEDAIEDRLDVLPQARRTQLVTIRVPVFIREALITGAGLRCGGGTVNERAEDALSGSFVGAEPAYAVNERV